MNKYNVERCSNCNRTGHNYRDCTEPITSWGIILVNLNNVKINHTGIDLNTYNPNIRVRDCNDLSIISSFMHSIRFLLVMRKHSLGYIEFLRGRYIPDNVDGVNFLFQQMVTDEIKRIGEKSFDELWNDLWNHDENKLKYMKKEYQIAKSKFEMLKYKRDVDLPLSFYVENVHPQYNTREWGFPKGRKARGETNQECALREFYEESGIDTSKIKIVSNIKPIEENLIGTNGVRYRHIYYVGEINEDLNIGPDNFTEMQSKEIADIKFFNYNDTINAIRNYHVDKKRIITNLFMYYMEKSVNPEANNQNESSD